MSSLEVWGLLTVRIRPAFPDLGKELPGPAAAATVMLSRKWGSSRYTGKRENRTGAEPYRN